MMEMPLRRARRSLDTARDFAATPFHNLRNSWHEYWDRADQRQQHRDIRRERMTCSANVNPGQTQDWTRTMGMSPSGRFQVVEDRNARQPILTRETIRWDAAMAVIIALIVILGGILFAEAGGIIISNRNISRLDEKITIVTGKNTELRQKLDVRSSDMSVCTEAVKLNLIAAGGAKTIALTAPGNANMTLTGAQLTAGATQGD